MKHAGLTSLGTQVVMAMQAGAKMRFDRGLVLVTVFSDRMLFSLGNADVKDMLRAGVIEDDPNCERGYQLTKKGQDIGRNTGSSEDTDDAGDADIAADAAIRGANPAE
jgi:hypothetical protein